MPDPETIEQWRMAVAARDTAWDGRFVYAVTSTGIFCRPSCPSRRPRADRIRFFVHGGQAEAAGYRACKRCRPLSFNPRVSKIVAVCRLIEAGQSGLSTLAGEVGWSAPHLQRTFTGLLGVSPKQYEKLVRRRDFLAAVQDGMKVGDAVYAAGYGSSRAAYEGADREMKPATYSKHGEGARITYAIANSPLGRLLVAATDSGVCAIELASEDSVLVDSLRKRFSRAHIHRDETALEKTLEAVIGHLQGRLPDLRLPLDIQATAFQRIVWQELRKIPLGETRSYSEVAGAIGRPSAARAVARACASNPVALAIPCHRVVRSGGELSGYRWGVERKRTILESEKSIGDNRER